ncbi:FAD-dependent oxidoreductase [Streptomyces sp. p1417]|uniref:FAD-dependent oxidoreductase n=1 Tax=Streptomyces typhae TaxID=2681492 RepID=A0A6L6XB61_9ACTN|nr:FAD-dependent oxidoreductase [Streptomyces typhae]
MYDVIVVGARCAGSPAALQLARAGYRVLMVERSKFPKDTLSTLYIHQPGVALLDQWGVLPEVVATGCPPLDRATYTTGDIRVQGVSWPVDGQQAAYAPRRFLLDQILARAAVDAGAELRENCSVSDLVFEDDRVVGVRLSSGGTETVERARLVIGADGMRSTVAAKVKAPHEVEAPTLTCCYYSYWSGLPAEFRLYQTPGSWVGTVPTNDGATLVAAYYPQGKFADIKGDGLKALLDSAERTAPEVRAEMDRGEQVERLFGTGNQLNFFRKAAGPGWALIGDAGHHKDSITARGITDAFLQAQLLVECIGDGLQDPDRLDKALGEFAEERTEMLVPDYKSTLKTAELNPPEHHLEMLRAIATSGDLSDRYFSTLSGACPIEEFVTEELLDLMDEMADA